MQEFLDDNRNLYFVIDGILLSSHKFEVLTIKGIEYFCSGLYWLTPTDENYFYIWK